MDIGVFKENIRKLEEKIAKEVTKAGYRVFKQGSVEICHWTKEAIKHGRYCYKHKFYGISTLGCMQISLNSFACTSRCIFCWRPNEKFLPGNGLYFLKEEFRDYFEKPEVLLEKLKELRKELLKGFLGNPNIPKERILEALEPRHVTFSLIGEPLLYPYMPEAIKYIRENWKQVKSIFIVSAGLVPEMVEKLIKEDALPTQFYITFSAYNKEEFKKINRPLVKDYWERFNRTIELLSEAKTRRVARITLIKGINDSNYEEWAKLIIKYKPHFVEVKGYSYLGYSRNRLSKENVPSMEEVIYFTKKLEEALNQYGKFEFVDEHVPSRVTLIKNREKKYDIDPIIKSVYPNV